MRKKRKERDALTRERPNCFLLIVKGNVKVEEPSFDNGEKGSFPSRSGKEGKSLSKEKKSQVSFTERKKGERPLLVASREEKGHLIRGGGRGRGSDLTNNSWE